MDYRDSGYFLVFKEERLRDQLVVYDDRKVSIAAPLKVCKLNTITTAQETYKHSQFLSLEYTNMPSSDVE